MAYPSPRAGRLRMWATVLVAIVASGLIVFMSSYAAFNPTTSNPTTPNPTTPNPTR